MKIKFYIIIGILLISLNCCAQNKQNKLLEYYYQLDEYRHGKVFKYTDPNDGEHTEYWQVVTDAKSSRIITKSFSGDFRLYNIFKEEVTSDGAYLIDYVDFEENEEGETKEIRAKVSDKEVYLNTANKEYQYLVFYTNRYGKFKFQKKRKFVDFETIKVNGVMYKTAKFNDQYLIKGLDLDEKYECKQETYYARGLGMIKYVRKLPAGATQILELEEIMSLEKFMKLKNNTKH